MPTKHQRVINLLDKHTLDGMLLRQVANFAWVTDGAASYINTASSYGTGTLLLTRDARYLITNTIEAPRFDQEEGLKSTGWEFHVDPWYQASNTIEKLTKGYRLGADYAHPGAKDLNTALAIARSQLDELEQEKIKTLSKLCARAMEDAIQATQTGMTEYQIAGVLARATHAYGVQPIVNLIATDERIYKFRHPLPTEKTLEKYAMLVLCGRQKGLVSSITRLVHFGKLPEDLKVKSKAVATIDAAIIGATRPSVDASEVFEATKDAYATVGYPDEYKLHHQGGPVGYNPREFINTPTMNIPIQVGQAYAWNPSITGCKSEDTILVGDEGNKVLTAIEGWPVISIEINGQKIDRPAIKVIDA